MSLQERDGGSCFVSTEEDGQVSESREYWIIGKENGVGVVGKCVRVAQVRQGSHLAGLRGRGGNERRYEIVIDGRQAHSYCTSTKVSRREPSESRARAWWKTLLQGTGECAEAFLFNEREKGALGVVEDEA